MKTFKIMLSLVALLTVLNSQAQENKKTPVKDKPVKTLKGQQPLNVKNRPVDSPKKEAVETDKKEEKSTTTKQTEVKKEEVNKSELKPQEKAAIDKTMKNESKKDKMKEIKRPVKVNPK